jgi:aminomethyltransferase
MWAPSSLAQDIFASLVEGPAAGRAAGLRALDARRIEIGVGRWGVDFGADAVANDTGLVEAAIDFTKGCYLGQEIVARIHYRGKPSASCCPLEVTGRSEAPPLPSAIRTVTGGGAAGEPSGSLTSAIPGPDAGSWLAIGTLSRRALDAGIPMMLEGGGVVARRDAAG